MTHCQLDVIRTQRIVLIAAMILVIRGISASYVLAVSGGQFELPPVAKNNVARYSKQSGLRLNLDTTWVGTHGYRPVVIKFDSLVPATADVQLTIRFSACKRWDNNPAILVEQDYEFSAGSTSATFSMLVPEYIEWRYVGCETWVDGAKDNELSMELVQQPRVSTSSQGGFGGLDISAMLLSPPYKRTNTLLLTGIGDLPADTYPWSNPELPATWLDYSSFDVVITSPEYLKTFQAEQPSRLAELLKWIRSGGNLWVLDAGNQYERIPDIQAVLGISQEGKPAKIEFQSLLERGWRFPKVDNPGTDKLEKLSQLQASLSQSKTDSIEQDAAEPSDSRKWFTTRLFGMGTVTAFAKSTQFARAAEEASRAITQSLLADRLSWAGRHGNVPDEGNDNFNDWLIPDVGTAPVTAFQALLTLFVLGIGPLNYYLLKRREQLSLLLLTVPTAAFATIFMLLIYSFLSDGFGTLVRARSFTLLDQRAKTAACWARLSYFAGIAPASGLDMPTDTLVYPILPASRAGNRRMIRNYAEQRRELHWDGSEKLLAGWLASRTPTQYLTITSQQTPKQIKFEPVAKGLQATNLLGVDIRLLVVVDADGKVFLAENLSPNKSLLLPEATQAQAMMRMRPLFSDNEPQFPAGTVESLSLGNSDLSFPLSRNLMETQISAISSAVSQGWIPSTFIAVTTNGMDLSLGMEDITESGSFHVVRGEW